MQLLHTLSITLLLLSAAQSGADEEVLIGSPVEPKAKTQKTWYYPFEIGELKIRQSNDGTGVIKEVSCGGCDYQLVRITRDTRVIVNGKPANLLRARERAGKPVFIEFDKNSAVVKYIYWME